MPSRVCAWTDAGQVVLDAGVDGFGGAGVEVRLAMAADRCTVSVSAPGVALTRIALRWDRSMPRGARVLGDAWERGYGDLEWRGYVPERPLPWYALVYDPATDRTSGFGVQTGADASALACWRVDEGGVTLLLDTRCGGCGVLLGDRVLEAAQIRWIIGQAHQSAIAVARELCSLLCAAPRRADGCVYGANDWYHAYGHSTAATILRDAGLVRDLAPSGGPAPYQVVDSGWEPHGRICEGGPYDRGNDRFPDMPGLAARIAALDVRPGIWIRPLLTTVDPPRSWRLPDGHPVLGSSSGAFLDPSVPEVLEHVRADIARLVAWGYRLIKHDFTTFDVTGRWGFLMGESVTADGWSFLDRTRTTAEIIYRLYTEIRDAAGDTLLIGCNTVGHVGAGLFELQRTGDDTSGQEWERPRKMGVNTLAFRLPQHGAFFQADADCVGLTSEIPWYLNAQWLDLLARSGTPLFVSAAPDAVGQDQRAALRDAFARAAEPHADAEPLDWMETTCPRHWRFGREQLSYEWGATW